MAGREGLGSSPNLKVDLGLDLAGELLRVREGDELTELLEGEELVELFEGEEVGLRTDGEAVGEGAGGLGLPRVPLVGLGGGLRLREGREGGSSGECSLPPGEGERTPLGDFSWGDSCNVNDSYSLV